MNSIKLKYVLYSFMTLEQKNKIKIKFNIFTPFVNSKIFV